jgi:hypothetical protein
MDRPNCDIIQDLLPLYVDDICSEASKQIIETHLAYCNFCKEKVHEFQKDDITIQLKKEKIESFKKFASRLKLRKICLALICIIFALVFITVADKIYFRLTWSADKVISYDKIRVLDVCQLSDGRIAFHTVVNDGYRVNGLSWHEEYPYPQISLMRGIIGVKNNENWERFSFNDCYWVFGTEQGKISYLGENRNETIIWQLGDNIPKASKDIEELLINRKNGAIRNDYN